MLIHLVKWQEIFSVWCFCFAAISAEASEENTIRRKVEKKAVPFSSYRSYAYVLAHVIVLTIVTYTYSG